MDHLYDPIAAISTPPGKGGVSVIRMCGEGALAIAERVFFPRSGKKLSDYPARMQVYGDVIRDKNRIDDCLACYFPAGSSYTGEETVEIFPHGGILVTRCVLEALFHHGARQAGKGEFTKRAVINGKLTLTEAEAIGDLLDAKSEEQLKILSQDSRSRLAERITAIKKAITEILGSLFARIDYPDEDLGDFDNDELLSLTEGALDDLRQLISSYKIGHAINEGVRTVICGKPNVGKSTIYNLILGEDAAIVTDISGTTRDVLEKTVPLGKVLLHLADTAGIRESSDVVESIGIERSKSRVDTAELIIAVFDLSCEMSDEDRELLSLLSERECAKIAVLNKCDKDIRLDKSALEDIFDGIITASARDGDAALLRELCSIVEKMFTDEKIATDERAIVFSARQNAALSRTEEFLSLASDALRAGIPQDAIASDVERALGALSELDGREVNDEVVSNIFSRFCVGK